MISMSAVAPAAVFIMLLSKTVRLLDVALTALVSGMWSMVQRAGERRRLSELSSLERQDLALDRVEAELRKWPWQH
jgi:hypothetical protein